MIGKISYWPTLLTTDIPKYPFFMQKELENYTNVLVLLFANFESDDLSPPHLKSVTYLPFFS